MRMCMKQVKTRNTPYITKENYEDKKSFNE